MDHQQCKSCGASIFWAKTEKGKSMPLDSEPAANGNFVIEDGVAVSIAKATNVHTDTPLYISHFATCKNAAHHRKSK